MGEMGTYTEWQLGEAPVGGMMDMGGRRCPPRCRPTGSSTSRSRTPMRAVEKVKAGGGAVAFGPIDIPAGRFAVVQRPRSARSSP